jgi:hypothetical protein
VWSDTKRGRRPKADGGDERNTTPFHSRPVSRRLD